LRTLFRMLRLVERRIESINFEKGGREMIQAGDQREKGKELDIEILTNQAMKLLQLDINELYVTLGNQLLARDVPSRSAEIATHLAVVRDMSKSKNLYNVLPESAVIEWGKRLGEIYHELRQDGINYLAEIKGSLRHALSNADILSLADQTNRSTLQIVVIIISGTLRMPLELEPTSVTIAAILFKLGLRDFCQEVL